MGNLRRSICTITLAITLALLSGCTEERALALKIAAEAFSGKAVAAIDATEELQLRATHGLPESENAKINETRALFFEQYRKDASKLSQVAPLAFDWMSERSRFRDEAFQEHERLKLAYVAFAAAYQRLPEGSILAARDVSCSAALGARLVSYMADAGKQLLSNPVPFVYESAASQQKLVDATIESARSGKDQALDDAIRQHVALLKEQAQENAEVAGMLLDAAESGIAVIEMIEQYDNISVADLLTLTRQLLAVRESGFGLPSATQIRRLDNVIGQLNSKPALAAALRLPLDQVPIDCRPL